MATTPTMLGSRGRALLSRLVRERTRERLAPLLRLRGDTRNLRGSILRVDTRVETLELRLRSVEAMLPRPPFQATMTIDQAWRHHPDAPEIFARYHLPACDSCAVRFDETLAEAAAAYGLEIDTLLGELNALLTGP